MKNLKISQKLIVGFGIILILLAMCVFFASSSLRTVAGNLDLFYNRPYRNVTLAIQIDMNSEVAAKYMLRACLEEGRKETDEMLDKASANMEQMQADLAELKVNYTGDVEEVAAVEECVSRLQGSFETLVTAAHSDDAAEAYKVYSAEIATELVEITETIGVVREHASSVATQNHDEGMKYSSSTIVVVIAVGIIAVLVGIVLAAYITTSITSAVVQLRNASQKMSQGDFSAVITYKSKDELGVLADSTREMMEILKAVVHDISTLMGELAKGNLSVCSTEEKSYVGELQPILQSFEKVKEELNETMGGIVGASDQVNSGAEQVSVAAQALAQGATEQASSVDELVATINGISQQVVVTAEHAETARQRNVQAHEEIQSCAGHMSDLMAAMSVIEEKSSEVGKVIKTIESISSQTNILSLNAAVEAARAGEAGKGFAVVAEEVRNLAQESAEAAKNTTSLIEEAISAVAAGSQLSATTEASLNKVVEDAQAILEAVIRISEATTQQADSIREVSVGIDQISNVVQTNSATAEQSAAASEELSSQAHIMKQMVSVFTLDEEMAQKGGRNY